MELWSYVMLCYAMLCYIQPQTCGLFVNTVMKLWVPQKEVDFLSEYLGSSRNVLHTSFPLIWGCIQKFLDWLSGARTANGTALCH